MRLRAVLSCGLGVRVWRWKWPGIEQVMSDDHVDMRTVLCGPSGGVWRGLAGPGVLKTRKGIKCMCLSVRTLEYGDGAVTRNH